VCFSLVYHRHVSVTLEFLEMLPNKISEFLNSIGALFDRFFEPVKYQFCFVAEKLSKNIILIFEIEINRTVSNFRFFGDL